MAQHIMKSIDTVNVVAAQIDKVMEHIGQGNAAKAFAVGVAVGAAIAIKAVKVGAEIATQK